MRAMLPSLKTIFMTNGCRENFPVFCNFSFTVILFNNSDFSLLGFTNKMQLNFTLLGPGDKKIRADTIGIHGVLLSLWVGRVADTRPCSPHSCSYIQDLASRIFMVKFLCEENQVNFVVKGVSLNVPQQIPTEQWLLEVSDNKLENLVHNGEHPNFPSITDLIVLTQR